MKNRAVLRLSLKSMEKILNLKEGIKLVNVKMYPEEDSVVFFVEGSSLASVPELAQAPTIPLAALQDNLFELNDWQINIVRLLKSNLSAIKQGRAEFTFTGKGQCGKTALAAYLPKYLGIPYKDVAYIFPSRIQCSYFKERFPFVNGCTIFYSKDNIRGLPSNYKLVIYDEVSIKDGETFINSSEPLCFYINLKTEAT